MEKFNMIIKTKPCPETGILKVKKEDLDHHIRASIRRMNEDGSNGPKKENGVVRFCLLTHGEGGIIKMGKTVFGHKLHGKEGLRIIEDSSRDSLRLDLEKNSSVNKEIVLNKGQVSNSNFVVLDGAKQLVNKNSALITTKDFLNLNLDYVCLKNKDPSLVRRTYSGSRLKIIGPKKTEDLNTSNKEIQQSVALKTTSKYITNTNKENISKNSEDSFSVEPEFYFDELSCLEEIVDGTSDGSGGSDDKALDDPMSQIILSGNDTTDKRSQLQEIVEPEESCEDSVDGSFDETSYVEVVQNESGSDSCSSDNPLYRIPRGPEYDEHSYSFMPPSHGVQFKRYLGKKRDSVTADNIEDECLLHDIKSSNRISDKSVEPDCELSDVEKCSDDHEIINPSCEIDELDNQVSLGDQVGKPDELSSSSTDKFVTKDGHEFNLNRPGLIIKPINNKDSLSPTDVSIERLERPLSEDIEINKVITKNEDLVSERIKCGDIVIEKITNSKENIVSYSQRDKVAPKVSQNEVSVNNSSNKYLFENDDLIIEKAPSCPPRSQNEISDKPSDLNCAELLPCSYNTTISKIEKPVTSYREYDNSYSQKYDGCNTIGSCKESEQDIMYQLSAKLMTEEALRKQNEYAYQYYDPMYWRLYDNLRSVLGPDIVDVYSNFIHCLVPESFASCVKWTGFYKSSESSEQMSQDDTSELNEDDIPIGPPHYEQIPFVAPPFGDLAAFPQSMYCQPGFVPPVYSQSHDPTGLTITPLDKNGNPAPGSQPFFLPTHQQLTITPLANPQYQPVNHSVAMGAPPLRRRGRPPLDPDYDPSLRHKKFSASYPSSYLYAQARPDPNQYYPSNSPQYDSVCNQSCCTPPYQNKPFPTNAPPLSIDQSTRNSLAQGSTPSFVPNDLLPQSSLASDVSLSPIPNSVAQIKKLTQPLTPVSSSVASLTPLQAPYSNNTNLVEENSLKKKKQEVQGNGPAAFNNSIHVSNSEIMDSQTTENVQELGDKTKECSNEDNVKTSKDVLTDAESLTGNNCCPRVNEVSASSESNIVNKDNQIVEPQKACVSQLARESAAKEILSLSFIKSRGIKNNMKKIKRRKKVLSLTGKKKIKLLSNVSDRKVIRSPKLVKVKNEIITYDSSDNLEESGKLNSSDSSVTDRMSGDESLKKNENCLLNFETQENKDDCIDSLNDSGVRRSGRKRKIIEGNPKFRDMERLDLSKDLRFLEKFPLKKKRVELKMKSSKVKLLGGLSDQVSKEIKLREELKRREEERRKKEELERKRIEERERKQLLDLQQFHEVNDIYLKPQTFF